MFYNMSYVEVGGFPAVAPDLECKNVISKPVSSAISNLLCGSVASTFIS